jgi:hypothetical protein
MADHENRAAQGAASSRLGGAVNTVLKMSAGAGLAVLGAYLFSRGRQHADLAARLDRLDALVKDLEKRGGAAE